MKYYRELSLRDGRKCVLRNGVESDGKASLENFILTHSQTDYLLSYPDEIRFTAEEQSKYLQAKTDSPGELELIAEIDGEIAGSAGFEQKGKHEKLRRRCEFGVSVDKKFWGLGIGTELLHACIECARNAGYCQMELEVVADNKRAVKMYEKAGFTEFGRNPRGFLSRFSGWQELIYMRLEF